MVLLDITVKPQRDLWRVETCTADFGNGLVRRLDSPHRKFLSTDAAVNYMKQATLREAKHLGLPVKGIDIECRVRS